ncbi:hypothetical protein [Entomospira culicis]|uniref:Uncharacterized protein n=2 Tax=Entomospira culicis TaxID=2719989 RepID=A0A968GJU7_9SPIO|nr:hypothetical protein [Entomospira culicis]NIZ18960.1 hypothetical protein [Entomospira culicis]NIZ69175.1 hypothetical protein [Entomospira culicis]WDI39390.1 hypothetical protein PVA47_02975 [Entomospira culicis]
MTQTQTTTPKPSRPSSLNLAQKTPSPSKHETLLQSFEEVNALLSDVERELKTAKE